MTRARKVLLSLLVVALVGGAAGYGTFSAFSASTTSPSNAFSSGTVSISDNHTGSTAIVGLSGAKPGDSINGCIRVTYNGSLPSNVRLYANVTDSGLAPYLTVTVTRGTDNTDAYPSCTSFSTTGESNYIGAGTGVIYNGTLAAFPTSSTATNEPTSGAPETWTTGESHAYEFTVTLSSSAPAAAQGTSANATFTWEAQNQ